MNNIVLSCDNLIKVYEEGPEKVQVLKGINLAIEKGERIAITGSSGSGKTTLLNLLGGLDTPSSGSIRVNNKEIAQMTESERGKFRNQYLGFIYQFHHLLPEFTALENVCMPLLIRGIAPKLAQAQASALLTEVGLSKRLAHKPAELSGGEKQRVAIARALVGQPACVLADEPTGNLDKQTAHKIHELIVNLSESHHISFIIVTHDLEWLSYVNRVMRLKNGSLE